MTVFKAVIIILILLCYMDLRQHLIITNKRLVKIEQMLWVFEGAVPYSPNDAARVGAELRGECEENEC